MAEPSEGAYALINVASQRALDVYKKSGSYTAWLMTAARSGSKTTQTFVFDKQSNGWQITCAATWKCVDATDATWAKHASDSNAAAQRWTVETDGLTATYDGTSYNTYTIKSKTSPIRILVDRSDAWAGVVTSSSNNYSRWILLPIGALNQNGSYKIIPAGDVSKCVEVSSGSTAESANVGINKCGDHTYQVFNASVDQETLAVRLVNANSKKALDVWKNKSGNPDNVGQYTVNTSNTANGWSQQWLITKVGSVKINGSNVPTYTLRNQRYTGHALTVSGNNVCVRSYSGGTDQRFAFMGTELLGSKLTVPGAISNTLFTRTGTGSVTVSGLSFSSSYTMFQVRYKLIKYEAKRTSKTETNWAEFKSNSSANDGWPAETTYSFQATPSAGIVTIPISKSITLNNTDATAVDMVIEVRAYVTNYDNTNANAHSNVKSTTIKIRQTPTVTSKSFNMMVVPDSSSAEYGDMDSVVVRAEFNESVGDGVTMLRAHLIGENGLSMSNWVNAGASLKADFKLGKDLHRLPHQNEKVNIEYSMLFKDNVLTSGLLSERFIANESQTVDVRYAKSNNDSYTVLIDAPRTAADACFMEVPFLSGTKLIPCRYSGISNNRIRWTCVPPLNKDVKVRVYSRGSSETEVLYGETTFQINSHLFMWNWGYEPGARESQYASLLINSDNPPQQKRSFASDVTFHSPSGRILPVAFASQALTVDLTVSGVVVDPNASYTSAGPLPEHGTIEYFILLSELSGKGIHPIYRTPYGDWYHVAISSVDASKNEIGLTSVSVSQRAMED